MVFLEQISETFKNQIQDFKKYHNQDRSDCAGQHFEQKYTICSMSLMKQENEGDFSATSHGKGDIDGLGCTCNSGIREKKKKHILLIHRHL